MQIECHLEKLEKLIKELKSPYYTDIGILGKHANSNIVFIGSVHEWGSLTGTIPERSFIRMPLQRNQKEIQADINKIWQKKIEAQDIKGIFQIIGISGEAQIQAAFETGGFGEWLPIQPETVRRKKGSEAILIDDGTLRKSITSEVGTGK